MSTRYTDLGDAPDNTADFVSRERSPSIAQLIILFLSALIVAIGVTLAVTDKLALIIILFSLLGGLGWYVIIQTQRNHDLVLTTEFQNALFSSALGISNRFCLIIKPDGNIVYFDRTFQSMFPDFVSQAHRHLDALLEHGKVSRENVDKIWAAIHKGAADKVVVDISGSDGQSSKIVLSVEPIQRPIGFILLRGRDFVEQRSSGPASAAETMGTDVKKKS